MCGTYQAIEDIYFVAETEMKKATDEQLKIAKKYKIPFSQAHLINMQKVQQYEQFLQSQQGRDEAFLNSLQEKTI